MNRRWEHGVSSVTSLMVNAASQRPAFPASYGFLTHASTL